MTRRSKRLNSASAGALRAPAPQADRVNRRRRRGGSSRTPVFGKCRQGPRGSRRLPVVSFRLRAHEYFGLARSRPGGAARPISNGARGPSVRDTLVGDVEPRLLAIDAAVRVPVHPASLARAVQVVALALLAPGRVPGRPVAVLAALLVGPLPVLQAVPAPLDLQPVQLTGRSNCAGRCGRGTRKL